MSHKPTYLTLFPGGHCLEFDMLARALEHSKPDGTVYERIGHSTGVEFDHNDRMLEMIKRFIARAEQVKTCKCLPESGCIESVLLRDAYALAVEVETYNANMLAVIAKYEESTP